MLTPGIDYSQLPDSSACIVPDGNLLFAVAEERISRLKHHAGFPKLAIQAGLDFAKVSAAAYDSPSVTHVDGSARPQTVEPEANPLYYRLIDEFGKITGDPVLMNTSFNLRGEAIEHTPTDALRTFFSSGMDALLMGSFLVEK